MSHPVLIVARGDVIRCREDLENGIPKRNAHAGLQLNFIIAGIILKLHFFHQLLHFAHIIAPEFQK